MDTPIIDGITEDIMMMIVFPKRRSRYADVIMAIARTAPTTIVRSWLSQVLYPNELIIILT
jgi:hypothetical protein